MNRLKKTLIISTFILSAIFADISLCSPAFAQSKEARDLNRKGADALESGRYADSIQFLKQAMALEPTWGEPCYNAARLLKAMGKREDMVKMLRKANGVEPNNPKYIDEYVKVLTEDYHNAELASNNSEIERIQNEIFRVNPGNLTFGIKAVQNKIKLDEKDEAATLAENILSKNATNRSNYKLAGMGELYLVIAQVAYDKGDLEKAKSNADYAARYEFGQRDEAYALLKKVKNDIDEKVKKLIEQATTAQKSGNHSKAMSLLQEAEKYQPDNETVKNTMVEFVDEVDINKLIEVARKANADGRWLDARETLVMTLPPFLIYSYTRVNKGICDICHEVAQQYKYSHKYHVEHNKRNISLSYALIEGVSDSGNLEQSLCDHSSAKESGKRSAKQCNDGNKCIPEGMMINNSVLRKTFSSCCPDVIRVENLKHICTCVTHKATD